MKRWEENKISHNFLKGRADFLFIIKKNELIMTDFVTKINVNSFFEFSGILRDFHDLLQDKKKKTFNGDHNTSYVFA